MAKHSAAAEPHPALYNPIRTSLWGGGSGGLTWVLAVTRSASVNVRLLLLQGELRGHRRRPPVRAGGRNHRDRGVVGVVPRDLPGHGSELGHRGGAQTGPGGHHWKDPKRSSGRGAGGAGREGGREVTWVIDTAEEVRKQTKQHGPEPTGSGFVLFHKNTWKFWRKTSWTWTTICCITIKPNFPHSESKPREDESWK